MTELSAERGGDPDRPGKKDPLDPLVWRAERPGEPSWESRFGPGRPGWHVECAAIAAEYLGAVLRRAGGRQRPGVPAPRDERVARAGRLRAGDGGAFARVYAHSGMVAYQGAKMSKSLGNLVFVSRLRAAGTDPMAIRLALLAHHYRADWEWTDEVLAGGDHRPRPLAGSRGLAATGSAWAPARPRRTCPAHGPRAARRRPGRPGGGRRDRRVGRRGAGQPRIVAPQTPA